MELGLTPADLAGLRFVVSPVSELVWSTVVLRKPKRRWLHRPWADAVEVTGVDLLLAMTSGTTYLPDFLQPVLPDARPLLTDELTAVAATPIDQATAQVDLIDPAGHTSPLLDSFRAAPEAGLARLAEEMERYFEVAIAPSWPRLRAVAEADIQARSANASGFGLAGVLADLHAGIRWTDEQLRIPIGRQRLGPLAGRPLVLTPVCFSWPDPVPATQLDGAFRLCYPPLGVGRLWDDQWQNSQPVLEALLGATRAKLLTLLAEPASTAELAERLGVRPPTASHHLVILRAAGLASQRRVGRSIINTRTFLGDQLMAASGDAATPAGEGRPEPE